MVLLFFTLWLLPKRLDPPPSSRSVCKERGREGERKNLISRKILCKSQVEFIQMQNRNLKLMLLNLTFFGKWMNGRRFNCCHTQMGTVAGGRTVGRRSWAAGKPTLWSPAPKWNANGQLFTTVCGKLCGRFVDKPAGCAVLWRGVVRGNRRS